MNNAQQTSVIIPAYNEEEGLRVVLDEIVAAGIHESHEVIVVNDGSTDRTAEVAAAYPVRLISHGAPKGYGAALKSGIRRATGDTIVTLDSDGEHTTRSIHEMTRRLRHCDMVIGERSAEVLKKRNGLLGRPLVKLVGEFLVEQKLPDFNSGYRGFDRELMMQMLHIMPNGFSFSTTSTCAFLREGYTVETMPIELSARRGRTSSVNVVRDGAKLLLLILRLTMLFNPLKIFFPTSLLFWAGGTCYGLFTIVTRQALVKSAIAVIFFGVILFFFGLLADQLAMLNRKVHRGESRGVYPDGTRFSPSRSSRPREQHDNAVRHTGR